MDYFAITHPTATLARGIEELTLYGAKSSLLLRGACGATARLVSTVVFPVFLTLELFFKRIPKIFLAIGTEKFEKKLDKAAKYFLAIVPAIFLGLYSPEGVPGFFLKRPKTTQEIRPFGVERVFGLRLQREIEYPDSVEAVQAIVLDAKGRGQQVSVIGAGMSQGVQTVPRSNRERVIHTKHLNHIQVNPLDNTVTVGAGATWEEVQIHLDAVGKSAIVKQASDIFSIGGSIGINCHGWAHQYGTISQTVRSLKVVDANGVLRELHRPNTEQETALLEDEMLFKCMFGTLGYFGIVVEATFDIVDNEVLVEHVEEVAQEEFVHRYAPLQGQDRAPLFGGRLSLDTVNGNPLRRVCMLRYERPAPPPPLPANRRITAEPKWGTRIQRVGLKLISHLPNASVRSLISRFWKQEQADMASGRILTRNQALHPPINAFKILHHSDLHAQWLQEYFIKPENLSLFLKFLGKTLKENDVRLINATIRPTPRDPISILPYAEQNRHAVVICFAQRKTEEEMEKTRAWIQKVNERLAARGDIFYQAYMPYASREQFEACYGLARVNRMRALKEHFDPQNVFGNAHTHTYYTKQGDASQ